MLECIAPGPDDIVLPKTSSNVFTSTNVDYILRSLEKKYLILAGCVTDQCVESAVREACDKHYYVTLVTGGMLAAAELTSKRLIIRLSPTGSVECVSACELLHGHVSIVCSCATLILSLVALSLCRGCRCMRNLLSGAA